jgi:hypothetical protein
VMGGLVGDGRGHSVTRWPTMAADHR